MKIYKAKVYRIGHPIAGKNGVIRKSRFVLYQKLNGVAGVCNWCGEQLTWKTLCADHLDSNIMNDVAENLVGSCRGCNANREDGTGNGRIIPQKCKVCPELFKPRSKANVYCSLKCSQSARPLRGTKAKHGTRSRYVYGCRCTECHNENLRYSREIYSRNK